MRVVLATHFPTQLDSPLGGVEAVSIVLANALATLPGMEVHVVTLDTVIYQRIVYRLESGVTVHRIPAPKGSMLIQSIKIWKKILWRNIKELSPDIVHAHDTYGIMVKGLNFPRIFTIHGFIHGDIKVSRIRLSLIRSLVWRMVETLSWADQSHIIAINPYVKNRLSFLKSTVIYDIENPIDECFYKVNNDAIEGIIFSSATICPRKNTRILIDAFELLIDEFPNSELRLAGQITDLKYGQLIKKRINQGRLAGKVFLLGQISREQVMKELVQASIFALVSLEESAPLGVSEAMAVGVPILTSRRCGMPYMIENGKSGYLVDPLNREDIYSKLKKLLANADLRAKMSNNCIESARNLYHPHIVAEKTREAYQQVMSSWGLQDGNII